MDNELLLKLIKEDMQALIELLREGMEGIKEDVREIKADIKEEKKEYRQENKIRDERILHLEKKSWKLIGFSAGISAAFAAISWLFNINK